MTITAAMVKELRDSTGAGMMDAKKALTETDGNMEAAVDWLRTKGLAKAAKKADRVAAEGLVGVAVTDGRGVAVEINSETDFVAKNADFQALVREVAKVALQTGESVEVVRAADLNGKTVDEVIQESIARIGENMTFRRMHILEGETVVSYVHNAATEGMAKIGVLVALKGPADKAQAIGKQFAMHIAATNPQAVTADKIDPVVVEREKAIFADQARASGKPENIIEKMVEGRLRKFYEEAVLLEQVFVVDTDKRVKEAVQAAAKELGAPIEVVAFVRLALGEGVEKGGDDFAAEVAQLAGV